MPSARDLRQRIRVDRRSATTDEMGGQGGWVTLIDSRFCSLLPVKLGARTDPEMVLAGRLQGTAVFDAWLRFDSLTSTIRPDDRVVDARDTSRVFNVRFVQDMDGRHEWMLLQLQLGSAEG